MYAPYHNGAIPPGYGRLLGYFRHSETNVPFEYAERADCHYWEAANHYPHVIFMADDTTRLCRVIKTRVYVVIDENDEGNPIETTWIIKNHKSYSS